MCTLDYRIRKYTRIPPTLQVLVDTLLQISFPWAFEHATPEHKDRFCSKKDIFYYIIAFEANTPIGYTAVLKRSIILEGTPVLLGGVGGMCVVPKKRRRGIGNTILDAAMNELQRTQCDIAYLCTDLKNNWLVNFYARVGFVPLRRSHTYTGKSGKRYTDMDGMIAPVCSVEKFQRIITSKKALDIGRGNW